MPDPQLVSQPANPLGTPVPTIQHVHGDTDAQQHRQPQHQTDHATHRPIRRAVSTTTSLSATAVRSAIAASRPEACGTA
jgi:uncharacterized protein YbbK (DUF523 family)